MYQHHPDGLIYVRHADGTYCDTLANFAADMGSAAPPLPAGYVGRIYDPGDRHVLIDAKGNETSLGNQWPDGDAIIAARPDLIAAKAAREAPPEPEPEPQP